ncbi:hypothetical protein FGL91_15445 [Microbacterium sp. CBA3102]|uniref:hypothetical protein n=1 Tax=Microbacterium sp. CBA3102 TaxID=2603598 RepID=UPI0011BBDE7E|nr:hypothetical protein [Microbacterium sp. CBA3102]QEA29827.1 hypothetical protein FGL91_15445 [Microbacterium sp. CBA3102]
MPETVRFILNRTSEPPGVLHREDCPTIQHQVRGDARIEQSGGVEILETYEDGLALVGPGDDTHRSYYRASYVSVEEVATIGQYRRCRTCVPDVPEGPPSAQVNIKTAETLNASDLGRVTVDGEVERIEHTRAGTAVTLTTGEQLQLQEGETVAFPRKTRK